MWRSGVYTDITTIIQLSTVANIQLTMYPAGSLGELPDPRLQAGNEESSDVHSRSVTRTLSSVHSETLGVDGWDMNSGDRAEKTEAWMEFNVNFSLLESFRRVGPIPTRCGEFTEV